VITPFTYKVAGFVSLACVDLRLKVGKRGDFPSAPLF
jgi:hypothetical protein